MVEVKIGWNEADLDKIGKYTLVRVLDRGGHGRVLEVIDNETGEHLAMKPKFLEDRDGEEYIKTVKNERDAIVDIGPHDHIIPLLGYDRVNVRMPVKDIAPVVGNDGVKVQVEDRVSEVSCYFNLFMLINARDPSEILTPYQAELVMSDIASALVRVHERGWVHRDVSRKNILVLPSCYAVLCDFGFAYNKRKRDDIPATFKTSENPNDEDTYVAEDGAIVGTPAYMSPEQVQGRFVGPRSDIYNLGACVYDMLTGVSPHVGKTPVDAIFFSRDKEPVDIRKIRSYIPERLGTLVMRMLSKNPEARGDAREIEYEVNELIKRGVY